MLKYKYKKMTKEDIKISVEEIAESTFVEIEESSIERIAKRIRSLLLNCKIETSEDVREEFHDISKPVGIDQDIWEDFLDEISNFVLDLADEDTEPDFENDDSD